MKLLLKIKEEVLGYSHTSEIKTDPPMGCGEGNFYPAPAYVMVENLFRRQTIAIGILDKGNPAELAKIQSKIKELQLTLETEDGEVLDPVGFQVADFREELPDIALQLEIFCLGYPTFERIFPGHHAAYVESIKKHNSDEPKC